MRLGVLIAVSILVLGTVARPLIWGNRMVPEPASASAAEAAGPIVSPDIAIEVCRGMEGFWRVGRTRDGVWWLIRPDGQPEFLNTVTTVVPYQLGRDAVGPHYVSRDWGSGEPRDDAGDVRAWADATLARVRAAGFKGLGAWCHPVFHEYDVPITRDLNLWTWVAAECRRFYSPHWAEHVEAAVVKQVTPLRDNRNLVGYFLDNELDWAEGSGPRYYFDHLDAADPNRAAVMAVIRSLWPNLADFNRDWDASFASFEALRSAETLPAHHGPAYDRLSSAWLEKLARDYFELTTRLVRKHDPNHLILGVRFKGYAPPEVVRACRGLTDVVSINYYVADARLDADMFRDIAERSDQPVMITEYSFHALDGRSGNRNTFGFAAQVLDQQARADGYRLFTTRLARVPYIVGADWFQWSDEPPSGRTVDGEDVNFGIVDVDDREYDALTDAVRAVTPRLNDLHASSHADGGEDVWRDSIAVKPSIDLPYLSVAPRLNGELSDWPAAARVAAVRRGHAVGSERVLSRTPTVLAAWNRGGLYFAFEVFDEDVQAAPATGAWWTRDNVELWIATRPVASDQPRYDQACHQFFFVPIAFPGSDGAAGVVGQWHRAGDAVRTHLVPHPAIRSAARVLPDRYVVEMFIPAEALHGFDPATTRQIALNFNVRDFQHASDFFFSAPKETLTQLRPNTWGTAYLREPVSTASR